MSGTLGQCYCEIIRGRSPDVTWALAHAPLAIARPRGLKPTLLRRRHGWTLFEAIAALTIGSTVFGIAVQLLSLTMHAAEVARDRVASAGAVARLAERFRGDVHAA